MLTFHQLEVGKVYNFTYTGPKKAYARINGKETVLVVNTSPLQTVQLYDPFGYVFSDDLRGSTITYERPEIALKETTIEPAADESTWRKHSLRCSSLAEAMQHGVSRDDIDGSATRRSVAYSGEKGEHLGHSMCFDVQDKTPQPLLQYIYVVWPTWSAMKDAFARHGVSIR